MLPAAPRLMALARWLVLLLAIVVGRPALAHVNPVDRIVLVAAPSHAEAPVAGARASTRATRAQARPVPLRSWSPATTSSTVPLASLQSDEAVPGDRWLRHCSILC